MKVLTIVTKSDSFVKTGETKAFDNITTIVEKGDVIELISEKKYSAILNKEYHRIIAVEW
jgi:hypothetical protein